MRRVGIRHFSFTFGDQKVWYRDLPEIEQRLRSLKIPDEEELWNWGYCRRASADFEGHVVRGFDELGRYLRGAGIEVDAVLACGPFQNSTERFLGALTSAVLPALGIAGETLRVVDDRDCANVLQALADARELIQSGCEHVLILAAEKMEDERTRFRKYSVFSDFCLALLVSADLDQCDHEIVDAHVGRDEHPGDDTSGILTRDLEKECVDLLLARNGMRHDEVSRFFYLNLFQPIAEMKGKDTGFSERQLHMEVKESGHCYGADPFINLHGYLASGGDGQAHVLCASGRAYAGVSLLRSLR